MEPDLVALSHSPLRKLWALCPGQILVWGLGLARLLAHETSLGLGTRRLNRV